VRGWWGVRSWRRSLRRVRRCILLLELGWKDE
jgi:hypothetical protein